MMVLHLKLMMVVLMWPHPSSPPKSRVHQRHHWRRRMEGCQHLTQLISKQICQTYTILVWDVLAVRSQHLWWLETKQNSTKNDPWKPLVPGLCCWPGYWAPVDRETDPWTLLRLSLPRNHCNPNHATAPFHILPSIAGSSCPLSRPAPAMSTAHLHLWFHDRWFMVRASNGWKRFVSWRIEKTSGTHIPPEITSNSNTTTTDVTQNNIAASWSPTCSISGLPGGGNGWKLLTSVMLQLYLRGVIHGHGWFFTWIYFDLYI